MMILGYFEINRIHLGFHFEKDIHKFKRDQMKFNAMINRINH